MLGMKANIPQMPGIAAFSDEIRDALRGPFSDDTKPGWLGGAPNCEESLKFGVVGCIQHPQVDMSKVNYSKAPWAIEPTQMMSYVSCHDDMCLVDRLKASIPRIKEDELIRLDLLAQTAVFTSQGVPFMLSGEELLRNKKGVHNSFESPDSINQLDWQNKLRYPQVFEYYKNLIALRKQYPHFRLGSAAEVRDKVCFLDAPRGVVAYSITGAVGCAVNNVIVVLNPTRRQQTVSIPEGDYTVVCASGVIDLNGIDTFNGNQVSVAPQSALIIHD
jgi:pullulanase